MPIGVCKLTGATGKLTRSHLIPKSLTKPEEPGLPLIQSGSGKRPVKRHTSWYDPNLVTVEGEALLGELDDWAIEFLRRKKLVWSGWGPMQSLGAMQDAIPSTPNGIRRISVVEPGRLRLFFLSLAWRAAASTLKDFDDVKLPADEVERLRQMILARTPEPQSFYPVLLTQLSTLGVIHNQSPFLDAKVIPATGDHPERTVPILRFYFDGLVAHVHLTDDEPIEGIAEMAVGYGPELLVTTVSYENSFQRENLIAIIAESASHPVRDSTVAE